MSENQAETIANAIRQTQKLRASVAKVFRNLADGCSVSKGNEKQILNEFHESLLTVNNDVGELEKIGNSLNPLSSVTPNSIHLSIDPAIDKTPIYNQIIQAYKWSNKVSELAGYASALLEQNVKIKRSLPVPAVGGKKQRRIPSTAHTIPPSTVDKFIASKMKQFSQDLTINITRPLGSHVILQVSIKGVLKAQIALRGLLIEWVNVRGFTEENPDESKLELWTKSRYEVFQKVTESATAATLQFYFPHSADSSLNAFLQWFTRYKTLFSAPCTKCGKHYLDGLPPTWRDMFTGQPYHDVCR